MNIEVRDLSETRKSLVVTVGPSEIETERAALVRQFSQQARLPGFRPGKVPPAMVEKRYSRQIEDELKGKVVARAYETAVQQRKLDVASVIESKPADLVLGNPLQVEFTVDIRPAFETPSYLGLPVVALPETASEKDVDEYLEALRRDRAQFNAVERPAVAGDYVQIRYEATLDGEPLAAKLTERPMLGRMERTWEEAGSAESVIPGLGAALVGVAKGDRREHTATFPADFPVEILRDRQPVYTVEVLEVRERQLPEVDEAFLKTEEVDSVEALRKKLHDRIVLTKQRQNRDAARRQVAAALAAGVPAPMPESLVERETQALLKRFLEDRLRQGVPPEQFEQHKADLHAQAQAQAIERMKVQAVLSRVAQAEKIEITDEELSQAVMFEASRQRVAPEKLARELGRDRDRLVAFQRRLLLDKTLEFVVSRATVQTSEPAQPPAPPASA